MKIFNCSRRYVETHKSELEADGSLFVVSINDFCKNDDGMVKDLCCPPISPKHGIVLFFDDATPVDIELKGITKVFDRKMAYFILESIEEALKNTEITHILVHCSAGISRSAAVSRILNDFVNSVLSENETDWEYNDKHGFELPPTPNPHILATMRNVLYDNFL